jgi:hypothetical protein
MDMIPKALIVGIFIPPAGGPGGPTVSVEKLNKIWSEVAPQFGYTQLQTSPDGAAAQFLGATPDTGVTIQPPLIQVRDLIQLTPETSAENAETVLKTISRLVGTNQFFNLGVRLVYHAPLESNDAKTFIRTKVLGGGGASFEELDAGGEQWSGVKHVITNPQGIYTLQLEPLQLDEGKSLYIDLDAQFPGPVPNLDAVTDRAKDAKDFLTNNVERYLNGL